MKERDTAPRMVRVQVMCNTCDSHLEYVFSNRLETSGLRYCINFESMELEKN